MTQKFISGLLVGTALFITGCGDADNVYDTIIYDGMVYDGSGRAPVESDIGIRGDRIVAVGDLSGAATVNAIDADGMAVSPGFINMLSWAPTSLIIDPRGMSDVTQGVTLEVFGEGWSMGPWNDAIKAERKKGMSDDNAYEIAWTTLGEYMDHMEQRGISPNIASFVGATTVRIHELGRDDVDPTPEQLARMQDHVRTAMKEGALGVGSSLIYAPAFFAETDELIALNKAASEFGGMYISHIRSESKNLEAAVEELITISREANVPAEIYHLKASGQPNWHKIDWVIDRVNKARAEGLAITADMYTYPASSTGLDASMPLWVQEGGYDKWRERLMDPAIRPRVKAEILGADGSTDSRFKDTGPDKILLVGFRNPDLRKYVGKTLQEVADERGVDAADAMIDLVIEDGSRVQVVYFSMDEENLKKKVAQPWLSFGSDAGGIANEGVFIKNSTHPRAYGTFARVIGKYVRDEKIITLQEAVRKMTHLPATNLKLKNRGLLAEGYYADVVIFDPAKVQDHATFAKPHQYSTGVDHVFVNGVQVLKDGQHTGATPGRVVRGPGWTGWTK